MKLFVLGAAVGALLLGAIPASAEVVVTNGNATVAVGSSHPHYRRNDEWRRHHASCRVIKVRTHRADGTVIIRTRRVC